MTLINCSLRHCGRIGGSTSGDMGGATPRSSSIPNATSLHERTPDLEQACAWLTATGIRGTQGIQGT